MVLLYQPMNVNEFPLTSTERPDVFHILHTSYRSAFQSSFGHPLMNLSLNPALYVGSSHGHTPTIVKSVVFPPNVLALNSFKLWTVEPTLAGATALSRAASNVARSAVLHCGDILTLCPFEASQYAPTSDVEDPEGYSKNIPI